MTKKTPCRVAVDDYLSRVGKATMRSSIDAGVPFVPAPNALRTRARRLGKNATPIPISTGAAILIGARIIVGTAIYSALHTGTIVRNDDGTISLRDQS